MSYTHQALVSDGMPPRPWCGEVGRSVMRIAHVDCPGCLQLDADRKARTEVHDAPVADGPEAPDYVVSNKEHAMALVLGRNGLVDLFGDLSVPEIIEFLRSIADDLEANGLPKFHEVRPVGPTSSPPTPEGTK